MKNKKEPKTFRFNFYWIYAIIALLFFGIQILSVNTNTKEVSWQEVKRDFLQNKEIEKIIVVNRERAEIFIKKEALKKERHKDVSSKSFGNSENSGPHYFFEIGSVDSFVDQLKEAEMNTDESERITVTYSTRKDIIGDAFSWIFPILIMIAIWIFLMRRMSGGGGAGGQIFNISVFCNSMFTFLFFKTKFHQCLDFWI